MHVHAAHTAAVAFYPGPLLEHAAGTLSTTDRAVADAVTHTSIDQGIIAYINSCAVLCCASPGPMLATNSWSWSLAHLQAVPAGRLALVIPTPMHVEQWLVVATLAYSRSHASVEPAAHPLPPALSTQIENRETCAGPPRVTAAAGQAQPAVSSVRRLTLLFISYTIGCLHMHLFSKPSAGPPLLTLQSAASARGCLRS